MTPSIDAPHRPLRTRCQIKIANPLLNDDTWAWEVGFGELSEQCQTFTVTFPIVCTYLCTIDLIIYHLVSNSQYWTMHPMLTCCLACEVHGPSSYWWEISCKARLGGGLFGKSKKITSHILYLLWIHRWNIPCTWYLIGADKPHGIRSLACNTFILATSFIVISNQTTLSWELANMLI